MKKSVCVLLCIFLGACAGVKPSPVPTVTATLHPITSTSITIVTATMTISTPTLQPSQTATPTGYTQEDMTQQANNPQATRVARATRIATEFSIGCPWPEEFTSPNKNWVATSCPNKQNAILEITNYHDKRWVLQFKDYVEFGFGSFHPEHWSNDGKYLYVAVSVSYSGGGDPCYSGFGLEGLYRIDLNSGIISNILPAGYDFSFSPTGRRLAYIYKYNGKLFIRDLQTGNEINVAKNSNVETFAWSPDGLELAYTNCENDSHSITKSIAKIFSIEQNASRTILEMQKVFLAVKNWDTNNIITIDGWDENYKNVDDLFFNTNTNQWITPTPEP